VATLAPIRYTQNGEVSIAYTVFGEAPVDLLFISGFVSHLEIGFELALAQRFWERMASFARVIAFDKRGMGLSDRDSGAYTLENVVDDALAVLDACAVERVAVFGVSEGGSAATMMAGTHPERVSALIQYGTYARVAHAVDHADGIPVERMRRFWGHMIDRWGEPESIDDFAPSAARDPEVREWWAGMLRSGVSLGQ
jgi:pimeloyl-ACP methyl ester carboxylesterase